MKGEKILKKMIKKKRKEKKGDQNERKMELRKTENVDSETTSEEEKRDQAQRIKREFEDSLAFPVLKERPLASRVRPTSPNDMPDGARVLA